TCREYLFRRPFNDAARAKTGLCIGCNFGFNADDSSLRLERLNRRRDSADQSSTANGDEHQIDTGNIFDNFQSGGALPGDDMFIVIRWDNDVPVLCGKFFSLDLPFNSTGAD